jgi:hypothetical protein
VQLHIALPGAYFVFTVANYPSAIEMREPLPYSSSKVKPDALNF